MPSELSSHEYVLYTVCLICSEYISTNIDHTGADNDPSVYMITG